MIVVYCITVAVAVAWLIHACILTKQVLSLRATLDSRPIIDHHECVERVAWYIGNEYAALVLTDAARRWDTVEERRTLERLRAGWDSSQRGVVAQWLDAKAEEWRRNEP